ncbi:MAG: hypothetical protein JXR91_14475 [Deltaproteobacteria bacterium]|nr:hypothetical protein [Deltaproteobacteria bacterium]
MRSQISKFRLLGIRAEPVEIIADTQITLKALFAAPFLKDDKPFIFNAQAAWIIMNPASLTPGSLPEFIINVTDVNKNGESILDSNNLNFPKELINFIVDSGNSSSLTFPVYLLGCNNGKIDTDAARDAILDIGQKTDLSLLEKACTGKDSQSLSAFKNLTIFDSKNDNKDISSLNHNPQIDKLLSETIICEGSDGCREPKAIKIALTPESFEYYYDYFGELRNEMEDIYVDWYSDGGEFSFSRVRSEDSVKALETRDKGYIDSHGNFTLQINEDSHWFNVTWLPPVEGGTFKLWATVRDLRGGIGWKQYTLKAIAPDYKK